MHGTSMHGYKSYRDMKGNGGEREEKEMEFPITNGEKSRQEDDVGILSI